MESVKFSGDPQLSVPPFLQQLTRVANQSFLSEGCLLWVMEDFMNAPALEAFRSQNIESFPSVVQWLLSSYAPENSLDTALRSVLAASQSPSETVPMFRLRLQLEASRLGAFVSTTEQKSLFAQGLNEPTHSLFASYQPQEEMEPRKPLSVLIQTAEQLETGMSSRTLSGPRQFFRAARLGNPPRSGMSCLRNVKIHFLKLATRQKKSIVRSP